jgi:hypothetical protein
MEVFVKTRESRHSPATVNYSYSGEAKGKRVSMPLLIQRRHTPIVDKAVVSEGGQSKNQSMVNDQVSGFASNQ